MKTDRAASSVDTALAGLALALLSYRFFNLDLVTFINDEPHLLEAAEREAHGGAWVIASPIPGTQGLHYGPVPTWFYGVIHLIFGAKPLASIVAMGLVVTLGQIAFAALLARRFAEREVAFVLTAFLVAASPFDFAWSRTAWDNTIVVGTFSCAALLLAEDELTNVRCLTIGTLVGLAVGSHLMVLPALIAIVTARLVLDRARWRATLKRLFVAGAPAAVLNLPYVWYLVTLKHHAGAASVAAASHVAVAGSPPAHPAFSLASAVSDVVEAYLAPARILTLSGIDYFFDGAWRDFQGALGSASMFLHDAWYVVFLAGFAIAGLWRAARHETDSRLRRIAIFALASWGAHATFILVRGIDPHPHYQHPVWWTVPTGIVLFAKQLADRRPKLARAFALGVPALATLHFAFLPVWMQFLRVEGGTRYVHTTTVLPEEEEWVRRACLLAPRVRVDNRTVIFPAAIEYLAAHDDACKGHVMDTCSAPCSADDDTRIVLLRYEGITGAHLANP